MNFDVLVGKTIANIENLNNMELIFTLDTGDKYNLYHLQDCCEEVRIEDICGDLGDLIGEPLLRAEVVTYDNTNPEGVPNIEYQDDSFLWTFYKLDTRKGGVTIRWYGESNGYYSEEVEFAKI